MRFRAFAPAIDRFPINNVRRGLPGKTKHPTWGFRLRYILLA